MFSKLYISNCNKRAAQAKSSLFFWENKDEGEAQRFEARSAHLA
jgi:hypothetical protein